MEFDSLNFFVFLVISLGLFFAVNKKVRWTILLAASFIFIASFSTKFLIYTIIYSIINYILGLLIEDNQKEKIKNIYYFLGLLVNIGMLVLYKYTNFIIDIFIDVISLVGISLPETTLNFIIPLGISFYTFQSIGYLIDIKRGNEKAERHIGIFALFILYFPKFISGPVERANALLPQLQNNHNFDSKLFNDGILQLLWGFLKTIIIADRLELIVFGVNNNLETITGSVLLINFFIQFIFLYFNFSGYTDIVLGVSKLFGIKLIENFNRPFFATNVSNYWRRWHMSLTTWCNDYIFRRVILKRMKWKKWAAVYASFLTFLIIGIWHGANWNFVILGILQGLAINYEFFTKKHRLQYGSKVPLWLNNLVSRLCTFIFICFSHVFFYTSELKDVGFYLSNLFKGGELFPALYDLGFTLKDSIIVMIGILIVFFSEVRDERNKKSIKKILLDNNILFWLVLMVSIIILIIFGAESGSGSLYQKF